MFDRHPLSSHAAILKTITSETNASTNKNNAANLLSPNSRPRYLVIDTDEPKPRPDMVSCFRRLYMADQFSNANETTQQTQDHNAEKIGAFKI